MGEAPEGSARPFDDTLARGRLGAGGAAGKHARDRGVLHQPGRGVYVEDHRCAGVNGYGEPVQKLFKLRDQERVIAGVSLDPRVAGDITPKKEGAVPRVHAIAVTSDGYSLRFGLDSFVEPSTRAGRRFARPSDGVEVVGVAKISGDEIVIAATAEARAILCRQTR
jgi:hypothetical protein